MHVLDSTPLIYLAKAEALYVLDSFETVTPEGVYDEVVTRGKEVDAPDARRVERHEPEVVEAPENATYRRLSEAEGLSDADAEVLALAEARDATAVMDEKRGRVVAEAEGIGVRGTAYLLLSSVKKGDVDAEEARGILDEMVNSGWYCSTSFYAKVVGKLEEVEEE